MMPHLQWSDKKARRGPSAARVNGTTAYEKQRLQVTPGQKRMRVELKAAKAETGTKLSGD